MAKKRVGGGIRQARAGHPRRRRPTRAGLKRSDDTSLACTASQTAYETSPEMLEWIKGAAGIAEFGIDLCATADNAVCPRFYSDLLPVPSSSFADAGAAFMNPPFAAGEIGPLVRKAFDIRRASGIDVAVMIPANSLGTKYMGDLMGHTEAERAAAGVSLHAVPRSIPFLLGGRRTDHGHTFTPVVLHLHAGRGGRGDGNNGF